MISRGYYPTLVASKYVRSLNLEYGIESLGSIQYPEGLMYLTEAPVLPRHSLTVSFVLLLRYLQREDM